MPEPVRVTITGAAGQIGYALAFRIASGQMLGPEQPVILQLLEIPPAQDALNGVVMELHDCAFTTLHGVVATAEAEVAFNDFVGWRSVGHSRLACGSQPKRKGHGDSVPQSRQAQSCDGKHERRWWWRWRCDCNPGARRQRRFH